MVCRCRVVQPDLRRRKFAANRLPSHLAVPTRRKREIPPPRRIRSKSERASASPTCLSSAAAASARWAFAGFEGALETGVGWPWLVIGERTFAQRRSGGQPVVALCPVYLAHIDDSGDDGVRSGASSQSYVLGCVMVTAEAWPGTFDQLIDFRRFVKMRFDVPVRAELKANFLLHNRGPLRRRRLASLPAGIYIGRTCD
jgi:hypothetical protein